MVRIDTLPEPLPDDIDDVGLRAAYLARGEEAWCRTRECPSTVADLSIMAKSLQRHEIGAFNSERHRHKPAQIGVF